MYDFFDSQGQGGSRKHFLENDSVVLQREGKEGRWRSCLAEV